MSPGLTPIASARAEDGRESSPAPAVKTRVVVLGSTGSVGRSGLDVIRHDGGRRLEVVGLARGRTRSCLLNRRGSFVLDSSRWKT